MPLRIRDAEPKDAEAIAGLHVRAWQRAYRGQLSDEYLDGLEVSDRIERQRQMLAEPGDGWRTWVAQDGGALVGFAVTGPSEDADATERTGVLGHPCSPAIAGFRQHLALAFDPITALQTIQVLVGELATICPLPRAYVKTRDRLGVFRLGISDPQRHPAQGTAGSLPVSSLSRGWSRPNR